MPGSRLTLQQREIIARGVGLGLSRKAIAVMAGCSAATVCRELTRERADTPGPRGRRRRRQGGGRPRLYRPERAHAGAVDRGRRPKPFRLTGALGAVVAGWLEAD